MTATMTSLQPTITATQSTRSRSLWRTGTVAGVAAAAAATAFAAVADAAGVALEVGGESIPLVAFAQLTLVAAIVGTLIAAVLRRRATNPQRTFVLTTVALTVLSFVPDVTADAVTSTRLVLALSHVVAAAIVIPALASRLAR
jgi:Family of unknown function (DUF6069)